MRITDHAVMRKRISDGLTTEAQFEKLHASRVERGKKQARKTKELNRLAEYKESWNAMRKKIDLARKVMDNLDFVSSEEELWNEEVRKLLDAASDAVDERQKQGPMPANYLFWYDCDRQIATSFRDLLKRHPQGSAASPLTIL